MQSIKFSIGDHKRYYISEYQHLKIDLPSIGEQIAIANVIEDIEKEIDLIERQLHKQTLLKQAMMQELLTGRIRLI
jgi:type I restriction enzyme S subunit